MAAQQQFEFLIPEGLSQDERLAIAEAVIDHIRERTVDGRKNNGASFPEYTDEYATRKGQSNVDLTDSGEMLSKLQLLRARKDRLVFGYKKGDKVNGKVEGNQLGSYGRSPNRRKARPFLDFIGSEKREKARIIRENIRR